MAKSAALRQGAATPTVLRDVADNVLKADVDTSTLVFGHIAAERLHLLANELEAQAKAMPRWTLAAYHRALKMAVDKGQGVHFDAETTAAFLAALQHDASDTTHRLSLAGVAAASAQKEAEHWQKEAVAARGRASNAELDRSLELEQLQRVVALLADEIGDAEERAGDTNITFIFANTDDPAALGVELAMELVMQLEELRA